MRLKDISMRFSCQLCMYNSDHPFGLSLKVDSNAVTCSGCITHSEKHQNIWEDQQAYLCALIKSHLKQKRQYDCVVPVVGDAEDYFTLTQVLTLGLSPLVVSVNDYFRNDIGWHNLHQLITYFDLDSLIFHPDLRVYKELVRTSLRKYDHLLLPFLQLHTSYPVHIAYERKIPLIIWGQHQAIEQVGKFSHRDRVQMSRWSRNEHDLFNVDCDRLIGNGAQVKERELNYYQYPDITKLNKAGVIGIYLSNYLPWDPLAQNYQALAQGFKPQTHNGTFDIYERAGSSVYYGIHDLLKMKRVGYRKVSDHLTREIRHGRLTRSQGVELQKQYQAQQVDIEPFFDWLDVTQSGRQWFIKHRLKDVAHLIGKEIKDSPAIPDSISSLLSGDAKPSREFILFGKGLHI